MLATAFGDEVVALPEKFGSLAVYGFADTSTKRIVAVCRLAAVGQGGADQPVLAVVAVFGDELLPGTPTFANEVAERVIVVMPVALHQQAVALDLRHAGAVVHQQVAGRVVAKAFRLLVTRVTYPDQAIERVVVVAALAVACVADPFQITVGAVGIIPAIK
ncbi:hypothetical protein D3C73_960380 [compost metagenome]